MKTWILALGLCTLTPSFAQHGHHGGDVGGRVHQPYSGMQQREIKSLSAQQMADLRAGKGMSLALAAELNGYPGPLHVLELAHQLGLSEAQKRATGALFKEMQAEAKAWGEQLIARERALDTLFRNGQATQSSVREAALAAARTHGELRLAHLHYHLRMMEVLDPAQLEKYNALRGYR